jgi:phenylacetate-CoA ligase
MWQADLECAPPERVRAHQLERLRDLAREVLPRNRFYASRLDPSGLTGDGDTFVRLPFVTKDDLVADQAAHPPIGHIATYARERYTVYHQTSGTSGRPLSILDTDESWAWWAECWACVYHAAGVTPDDRVFFAFSFGPFIGFWSAYAGARLIGALTIPGGGMDTRTRLDLIARTRPTVLVSTPTYALRLAEIAREIGLDLRNCGVGITIHAGEPGASIPAVRDRIQEAWGARCLDHIGATEVGAYGYTCEAGVVHVNEAEFIAEVIDPVTMRAVAEGEQGELVMTNLGRPGWPAIRYRTGDLVQRGGRSCACGRTFLTLPGGVIGRADDLMIIRGVNIYPSSVEAIVRRFPIDEFRIVRTRRGAMEEIALEVECAAGHAGAIADALHQHLGIRFPTTVVPAGSLPRFELKARRVVDLRDGSR